MKPPCKRHELAGLTEECFCPDPVLDAADMDRNGDIKWSYGPRWGRDVAICTVTYHDRVEQWASKSIYVTPHERYDVPKMLLDRIKATIRLFGELPKGYDDDGE